MKYITLIKEQLKKLYAKLTETKEKPETPEIPDQIVSYCGAEATLIGCEVVENDEGITIETTKAVQLGVGCVVSTSIEVYTGKKQTVSISSVFIPNAVVVEKGKNSYDVMEYDVVDIKNVPKPTKVVKETPKKEPAKTKKK